MKWKMQSSVVFTAFLLAGVRIAGAQEHLTTDAQAQVAVEENTSVMQSTFKIVGNNEIGSGFVLARPYTQAGRQRHHFVLVTAAHVFTGNDGEFVTILFRRQTAGAAWEQLPTQVRISAPKTFDVVRLMGLLIKSVSTC